MSTEQRCGRDTGSVSVMLTMLMIVMLAGAGLVVDGGRAMAARRHASNTAEAAARAAVSTGTPLTSFDHARARSIAVDHAVRAGIEPADVEVRVDAESVTVTITERRDTVFLVLGGAETMTVHASGTATLVYSP